MKIGRALIRPAWGDIPIWKYKSFEYQFEGSKFCDKTIELCLEHRSKTDHAGISFTFGIKHLFWMNLNIHDHRNWDDETNAWEKY